MKHHILKMIVLSLCMLSMPTQAMDNDDDLGTSCEFDSDSVSDDEVGIETAKTSATFFIHIKNPEIAYFYASMAKDYKLSLRSWKKQLVSSDNDSMRYYNQFMNETRPGQKLCIVMKRALKKFGATQIIKPTGVGVDDYTKGAIVELTMAQEQPVKEVVAACKKSEYVTKVFSKKEAFQHYIEPYTREERVDFVRRHLSDETGYE